MPHALQHSGRIGVVDIGSNSIRLVVYDQLKRAPTALYNEKVICQLGKGLALTGKLNPQGAEMARATVARFLALARAMEVTSLDIIATAAVRDASDGEAFVIELEKKHNVHIETISGRKEARLGAYGVCASMHEPRGLTGDLGGGSMELTLLDNHLIKEQATLPVGPLRLLDETGGDRSAMQAIIRRQFAGVEWLKRKSQEHFFAIGGSFRALAKMHLLATGYPLNIVHEYTVAAPEFMAFLKRVAEASETEIAAMPGAAGKRVGAMPPAALILAHVLELGGSKHVIFSASGIREGYLYEKLSPYLREEDVFLSSCQEYAQKGGRGTEYAQELLAWTEVLFPRESARDGRLRFAACLLHDIANYIHPEHRAEWAIHRILQSHLMGIDHPERVQLGLTLYHRYQFKLKHEVPALALLDAGMRARARVMGSAMNLAYHLTGGIAGTLPQIALEAGKTKLSLKFPKFLEALAGEAVKKRLSGLEEAWGGG